MNSNKLLGLDNYSTGNNGNSKTSPQDAQIVLKMAEKVKLRRTTDSSENVTTTDVINTAVSINCLLQKKNFKAIS